LLKNGGFWTPAFPDAADDEYDMRI
jgi:hypothetical protein